MTTNAIALSRGFSSAGMEKPMADAVAEAIATHNSETFTTKQDLAELKSELKADIARLDGRVGAVEAKINIMLGLMMVMCAAIVSIALDKI